MKSSRGLLRVVSVLVVIFAVALILEAALAGADSTEVPFEVTFNLTIVKVRINGKAGRMMFDTGASTTIILPEGAKKFGLKGKGGAGIGAGLGTMGQSTVIDSIQIGEIEVKKLGAYIMKIPQLEAVRGLVSVDGIIGYNFAKRFIITLDYPRKRLIISKPGAQPVSGKSEERAEYKSKAKELARKHIEVAEWCEEKELDREAKARYEAALELDPDNGDARRALGREKRAEEEPGEEETGEEETGRKTAEKKQTEKMTGAERSQLHSEAVNKLRSKEYDQAEEILQRILRSFPGDQLALYNLTCIYSLQNKKEKAIEYLGRSIEAGYTNYRHIESDSDLDNIREEEGYKKLLRKLIRRRSD